MKKIIKKSIASFMVVVMMLTSISVSGFKSAAANQNILSINWDIIKETGHQSVSGPCACYALAYCRDILDNKSHSWTEYSVEYLASKGRYSHSASWGKADYADAVKTTVQATLKAVYDQINNGRPAIIYVKGGRATTQHWVAVVGYQGVTDVSNLKYNNFLIIDSAASKYELENLGSLGYSLLFASNKGGYRYVYTTKGSAPSADTSTSNTKYSFNFNANGGTLGSSGAFSVKYGEQFQVVNTTCTREGYTWAGWNVKRNNDNKWYVDGHGWCTESQISSNGYLKKVYPNNKTLTLDNSWISGISGDCSYTFYAVWLQARSTKIKVFLSPYGDGHDHITAMNNSANSGFTQNQIYAWYVLYDGNTGELLNTYSNKNYSVKLEVCDAEGKVVKTQTYSDSSDVNCIGITPQMQGTYTITATISGDYKGSHSTTYKASYDPEFYVSHEKISLNLNGTNSQTVTIDIGGSYPGKYNIRRKLSNSNVSTSWGSYSENSCTLNVTGNKVGNTDITIELFEEYTGNKNVVATITIPVTITANTYTISYNANGGFGAPSSQQKSHNTDLTLSSTVPTGKTYTVIFNGNGGTVSASSKTYSQSFAGWNTNSSGTGTSYQSGGIYSYNQSQTLYAKWENPKLSVSDPTRSGYYFLGWYDSTSVDDYGLPLGKRYTSNTSLTGNVTLYAMWSKTSMLRFGDYNLDGNIDFIQDVIGFNDYRLGIVYENIDHQEMLFRGDVDADGDIDMDDITILNKVRLGELEYENLPACEKLYDVGISNYPVKTEYQYGEDLDITGLAFMVYYTSGTYYTFKNNLVVSGYDPYKIGTQTLQVNYYQYTDTFTVTVNAPKYSLYYNANGGSLASTGKTVTYNSSVGTLPTPERDGYKFLGWSFSENSTSYITSSTIYSYKSNKTLYAQWEKIAYTLSYNANGGSGAPASQTGNTIYTLSSNVPKRFGYTFLGWAASSNSTTAQYEIGDNITLANNITLYAVWKSAAEMSSGSSYSTTIDYAKQERYYKFTPSTSGKYVIYSTDYNDTKTYLYNSSGTELTNDDNGGIENNFRLQYNLTAGTTYFYKIVYSDTAKTGIIPFVFGQVYTISYNANGGSGAPSIQNKDYGAYTTLSTIVPIRSGYTFLGWATSPSSKTAEYVKGDIFESDSDVTLYAVWESGDTTKPTASISCTNDVATSQTVTLSMSDNVGVVSYYWGPSSSPANSSFTSITSATNKSVTKTVSEPGTYYLIAKDTAGNVSTATITFNKLTFNGNNGIIPYEYVVFESGKLFMPLPTATREGYEFLGWSTSSSATSATYQSGGTFTTNADTTLYAVWKANTYTVKYNANGGTGSMSNSSHTYDTSKALLSNAYSRTGYTFLGWSTSNNATTATYTNGQSVKNLTSINGDTVNLYAVWSKIPTYTISYNANGGSDAPASQTKTNDVNLTLSSTKPTRSGYTFLGWSTSSTATSATYQPGGSFTSDANTTLYAVWKANTYTVKYNANGGSGSMSNSSHTYDVSKLLTANAFSRTGYTFLGWSISSSATSATYTNRQSVKNLTSTNGGTINLYAVWGYSDTTKPTVSISSTNDIATSQTVTLNLSDNTGVVSYYWGTNESPSDSSFTSITSATNKTVTKTISDTGTYYLIAKDAAGNISSESATFYKFIFNANNGTISPEYVIIKNSDTIILPTATRDGYIFLGWAENSTATDAKYKIGTSYGIEYSINLDNTFYAVWQADEPEVLLGDVNEDNEIDAGDAVIISRYDAGFITLTEAQLVAADVNKDGYVDAGDAVVISRYDAGLIDKFVY